MRRGGREVTSGGVPLGRQPGYGEGVERLDVPRVVRVERRLGVAAAHRDQLLDEFGVEEQVAQELAVGRALAAQQAVQQREVRRAQRLDPAEARAEDRGGELADRAP